MKRKRDVSRINIYKTIYPFTKKYSLQFALLLLIKIAIALISLFQVYLFKILVDDILIQKKESLFWYLIGAYLLLFIFDTIFSALQLRLNNKTYNLLKLDLKRKILGQILNVQIGDLQKVPVSEIKMLINDDVEVIPQIINSQFLDFAICLSKITSYLLILLNMNLWITLLISVTIPIFFLATKKIKNKLQKIADENRSITSEYEEWIRNSLEGWKDVKTLIKYQSEEDRYNIIWKKLERNSNMQYVSWFVNRAITLTKDFFIINVLLYLIGGILIISGNFTIGSMLIYINYFQSFFSSINDLNSFQTSIHELIPQFNRIQSFLEYENIDVPQVVVNDFKKRLKFENIKFSYNSDMGNILSDISFTINKGDIIRLSGKSGVGKSTLIKILLKFYKPQSGDVLLDETSVFDIADDSYYKIVGACLQDDYFFDSTISENLLIGKHNITELELIRACKTARIHDDIMKMPQGYDTRLISSAQNISGGQKQRLALARLILHDPQIIILDEATAAIDNKTETTILNLLLKIFKTKTIIIISHNESIDQYVERNIVIENRIQDSGG